MTRDFEIDFDPELEGRLRDIARRYEPQVPVRIRRFAAGVASASSEAAEGERLVMARTRRPALIPRLGKAAFGLAAASLVVAIGVAALLGARQLQGPRNPSESADLRWRDVSATSFPSSWVRGTGWDIRMSVVYWHGAYYANPHTQLWSSPDGYTWQRVQGRGAGALMATDDLLLAGDGSCFSYTTDGRTWNASAALPPPADMCRALAAYASSPSTALVVIRGSAADAQFAVMIPYWSTDGATWTKPEMPEDMTSAAELTLALGRNGFLAEGMIPDRSSYKLNDQGAASWSERRANWYSKDGSSWQQVVVPASRPTHNWYDSDPGPAIQRGALGDWLEAGQGGYHSVDDLNWIPDTKPAPMSDRQLIVSSDGSRIIAQAPGPTFYESRGDGTWHQLQSGGEIAAMPDGGRSWVLPAGVLYVCQGHVFFGTLTN